MGASSNLIYQCLLMAAILLKLIPNVIPNNQLDFVCLLKLKQKNAESQHAELKPPNHTSIS